MFLIGPDIPRTQPPIDVDNSRRPAELAVCFFNIAR